ncbi:MAG: hypothetical protein K2X27_25525, partial [Candidatus Obscuribacterales bacterium]|nr:hypothetical protein [Candidatus Obscuribacterales bacterium]
MINENDFEASNDSPNKIESPKLALIDEVRRISENNSVHSNLQSYADSALPSLNIDSSHLTSTLDQEHGSDASTANESQKAEEQKDDITESSQRQRIQACIEELRMKTFNAKENDPIFADFEREIASAKIHEQGGLRTQYGLALYEAGLQLGKNNL